MQIVDRKQMRLPKDYWVKFCQNINRQGNVKALELQLRNSLPLCMQMAPTPGKDVSPRDTKKV